MSPLALLLLLAGADGEPRRLGDDGFRIGQAILCSVRSPDGRRLAVAGQRGGVYVLDAATGQIENAWDVAAIEDLAFDGDEQVVTLSADGWLRTYHARSGQSHGEVLLPGIQPGERIAGRFVAGGHLLWRSSADPNQPRLLHDRRTGLVVRAEPPISPSSACGTSGSRPGGGHVRHPDGPASPVGHQAPLRSLAFADADILTTLDHGGAARFWDVRTGAVLHRARVPLLAGRAIGLDPTGRAILVKGHSGWANLDLGSGRLSATWEGLAEGKNISPDGRRVLRREDGRLRLREIASGRTVALPADGELCPDGDTSDLRPVWSTPGDLLALDRCRTEVRGRDLVAWRDVPILETVTGREVARIRTPDFLGRSERGPATDRPVQFGPDGSLVVVRWRHGLFGIYGARTGRLRHHFYHPDPAGWLDPLAWSPDGRCLLCEAGVEPAAASELWLVEVATGSPRWRRPASRGLDRGVAPCFSPDGQRIALALTDATVLLLPADGASTPTTCVPILHVLRWANEWLHDAADRPVADWLADLDHDDFDCREAARLALARRPDLAQRIAAAATSPSLHLRQLLSDLAEERLEPPTRRPPP